jgi:YfiH family protein
LTEELLAGEPQADAAFTTQTNIVLAVLTADCLPILVCADDGSEIAAIHAGWRGLGQGVIQSCVQRLRTPRGRLLAWLGPAIGQESYEVGEEVRAAIVATDAGAEGAFAPTRPGHWLCDLYTLARRRLNALGVARIYGGGFDTYRDPRFYSYRRDGVRSGRFASLIWRTESAA